jgi:predicted dehydrogenase
MLWLKRLEGLRLDGRPVRPVAVTGEVASPRQTPGGGNVAPAGGPGEAFPGRGVEGWGILIAAFEDGSRGVAIGSDTLLGGMQSRLVVLAADHHLECNLSPQDALRAYAPGEDVFGDAYIMEKVDARAGWSTPMPDEDWTSGQQGLCQSVAEAAARARGEAGAAPSVADPSGELPPVPDGELGLDVVRCIYAAYLSAEEGRRVSLEPALGVP